MQRSRFRFLSCSCACLLLLLAVSLCWAASGEDARKALETSISRVLDCIKDPKYAVPATRPPLRQNIEKEVRSIFDFEEFSSRTVGASWRNFSPERKKEFSDAFANLLLNTYLEKINGYNGEYIAYNGEVVSPSGDRVEVRTTVTLKDGKAVPVAYRLLPKGSSWHVYDVLIEGISLVKNYRTQFQDILTKGTPEELIARVRDRARVMQEKANAVE